MLKYVLRLKEYLKERNQRHRRFFFEGREQIAEGNFRMMRYSSMATVLFLLLFLLTTPFIIEGWHASVYHIVFLPVSVLVCLIFNFMREKGGSDCSLITTFCILFEIILFTFLILIDTVGSPEAPASFIPVALIAVPTIFTLPYVISIGLPVLAEIGFLFAVVQFKTPALRQYDIFGSLFALVCAIAVSGMIRSLHIRDHENQMKYKYMSTRDSLSSILNKQTCSQACRQYLACAGDNTVCALIILDLDNFKQVNDTRGHIAGDTVIRCMGEILLSNFRHSDIVGRFGGDEFLVLIKGTASLPLLNRKCETIQKLLRRATREEIGVSVSCSIGGVLLKNGKKGFEELFQEADMALYQAKKAGKGRYKLRVRSSSDS